MKNKILIFFMIFLLCNGCTTYIGEKYLGQKYLKDPLGEEKAPDVDALIRYDAFDCVTFVETAIANGDKDKLTEIRYKDGKIDFLHRNHFIETDWLVNNSDKFENISDKYAETTTCHVVIDKQNWFKKVHNIKTTIAIQSADIKYIPYRNIRDIETQEPLIVLFIYGNPKIYDKIGTDIAVVHMGFLLPNGKLRHASKMRGLVLDVDFKDYITKLQKNKHNLGIALVKIK